MNNPELPKPLTFGTNHKQVTRKLNLIHIKSDAHLTNPRSASKSGKSKKRPFESPKSKQKQLQPQREKSRPALSFQAKNGDEIQLSKKYSECTRAQNNNSSSIRDEFPQRSSSKSPPKMLKKSLNKAKSIVSLQWDKKVRKLSDNTNQALKLFEQLRHEHIQEEKLMKLVLNQKELHRYQKILAVQEAHYLNNVLSFKQPARN